MIDTNMIAIACGIASASLLVYLYIGMRRESGQLDQRLRIATAELEARLMLPSELHRKHGAEWDRVKALEDDAEFLRARDEMVKKEPLLTGCVWFNHEEQVRERTLLRLSQLAKK